MGEWGGEAGCGILFQEVSCEEKKKGTVNLRLGKGWAQGERWRDTKKRAHGGRRAYRWEVGGEERTRS